MNRRALVPLGSLAAVAVLALALGGCTFSTDPLSGKEVAKEAQEAFDKEARKHGEKAFPPITCPDSLDDVESATTHCYATAEGEKLDIRVEVTEVEDSEVNMHFEVVDHSPKK